MEAHYMICVGRYKGNFQDLVGETFDIPYDINVWGKLHKCWVVAQTGSDDVYVLAASDCGVPGTKYNIMTAAIGPDREKVRKILDEFNKSIGLETVDVPEVLQKQIGILRDKLYSTPKPKTAICDGISII